MSIASKNPRAITQTHIILSLCFLHDELSHHGRTELHNIRKYVDCCRLHSFIIQTLQTILFSKPLFLWEKQKQNKPLIHKINFQLPNLQHFFIRPTQISICTHSKWQIPKPTICTHSKWQIPKPSVVKVTGATI